MSTYSHPKTRLRGELDDPAKKMHSLSKLEDAPQLFWVPAHLHPEIAPQEFEAWLDRCNVRVNDFDTSSQSEHRQITCNSSSYRKLNRRKSSLRREANLTEGSSDISQPPLLLRASGNYLFGDQAELFDEDPELTETPAALRKSLTGRVSYISDSECAEETTQGLNTLVRGGSGWRALKRSVRTNRVRRGSEFSEGDSNDARNRNRIQRNRSENFADRRKVDTTSGRVLPKSLTITISAPSEEKAIEETGSLASASCTDMERPNDEVLNCSIWTPLSTVPLSVSPKASSNETCKSKIQLQGNDHLANGSSSEISDIRNIPPLPTTSAGNDGDDPPKKEPRQKKMSSWSKLNFPITQLVAKMASSNSEKSANGLKKNDSGIDLGDPCPTNTSSESVSASEPFTQKQRKTTTTAAIVALFSTLSSSRPSKQPALVGFSESSRTTVPTSPTSAPPPSALHSATQDESATSIPPPVIQPYHLRSPNRYSNYNRFPIHVERALYRLSHTKLANARRPLYHQVLISNMMFWYLALISKQQQQQQLKLQSESLEAFSNASTTSTHLQEEKLQQKIVKDKEKERKRHERQTEQAAKKLSQRVAKQASIDARRKKKEEKGREKENLKIDKNAPMKEIGSTGNLAGRGKKIRMVSSAGTSDICIAPNLKNMVRERSLT